MCLMCIEIAKDRMTPSEARRALPEMISGAKTEALLKHYKELEEASDEELRKIALKKSQES
ncbi:MAG: hypothetical protein K2X47_07710 [Bdellovibrionales bacterium]|nr:hypothetical protein [Bdellovibrionales bacterium]